MKLISCYVKDFGTLSNFSYSFRDGLNALIADNGSGKSTLAVFIKTMFYGFDGSNKRALSDNERKKYTPWSTKRFGGSLDFSLDNNKSYRIERFFEGSESVFKLYDLSTNKPSSDYSENIGVELFGIDREGFERSTYYPQTKVEEKANTTISAKLTSLSHDTSDINSFDKANKILDDFRKELTSSTYGKIQKVKKDLEILTKKVNACEDAKASFERLKSEKEVYESKLNEQTVVYNDILLKKDSALKQSAQKEINEHYAMLENDVAENERALSELNGFFNGNQVLDSDIKRANENLITIKSYESNNELLSENSSSQKAEIEEFFNGNVPTLEEVESVFNSSAAVKKSSASKVLIVLSIISLVLACGLLFVFKPASIGLFVVSAVLFFAFMFTYFNSMMKTNLTSTNDAQVIKFLSNYIDDLSDIEGAKNIVRTNAIKYQALSNLNSGVQNKEYYRAKNELNEFLSLFNIDGEDNVQEKLYIVESKFNERQNLLSLLNERKTKLSDFVSNKNIVSIDNFDLKQIEESEKSAKVEIDAINYELAKINNLIDKEQAIFENYESVLEERQECEDKLRLLNEMASDVVLAKEFLQTAKDALNSKYLGKMQDNYKKYCKLVTDSVISHPVYDSNLKFSFIYNGEVKDKEYLSEGLKDITDVCSRLALCDSLYEEEKPMLIFDDPFVNLDDEKLDKAKSLLKEVSKNYQVIYLVCHSSRLI